MTADTPARPVRPRHAASLILLRRTLAGPLVSVCLAGACFGIAAAIPILSPLHLVAAAIARYRASVCFTAPTSYRAMAGNLTDVNPSGITRLSHRVAGIFDRLECGCVGGAALDGMCMDCGAPSSL